MANGIPYDGWERRLSGMEISVSRNTEKIESVQRELTDFKTEMRSDIKEIKAGQRSTILSLLAAAIAFGGAAVPLIILVASQGGP